MTATYQDIEGWAKAAQRAGATYLIVADDTFDHENFPVRVAPGEDIHAAIDLVTGSSMQRIDEVYDLSADLAPQLAAHRAWNVPPRL